MASIHAPSVRSRRSSARIRALTSVERKAGRPTKLATYNDDSGPTEHEAEAFVDALDAWLARVHAKHPIALVIGWSGSPTDALSKWSVEQIPTLAIRLLRELAQRVRAPSGETRHRRWVEHFERVKAGSGP